MHSRSRFRSKITGACFKKSQASHHQCKHHATHNCPHGCFVAVMTMHACSLRLGFQTLSTTTKKESNSSDKSLILCDCRAKRKKQREKTLCTAVCKHMQLSNAQTPSLSILANVATSTLCSGQDSWIFSKASFAFCGIHGSVLEDEPPFFSLFSSTTM